MSSPTRIIGVRPIRWRPLALLRERLRARRARQRLAELGRNPALARDIGLSAEPPQRDLPRASRGGL